MSVCHSLHYENGNTVYNNNTPVSSILQFVCRKQQHIQQTKEKIAQRFFTIFWNSKKYLGARAPARAARAHITFP